MQQHLEAGSGCSPVHICAGTVLHLLVESTLTCSLTKCAARLVSARGVDGILALLDVPDDAVLVYGEGGARAVAALLVEDAVVPDRLALEVAQQREGRPNVLLEAPVGREAVNADA